MTAFGKRGQQLLDRQGRFKINLGKVNRRCAEDERFCEVTEVARANWDPFAEECREHRRIANWHRGVVSDECLDKDLCPDGCDSIKGWCECRNRRQEG